MTKEHRQLDTSAAEKPRLIMIEWLDSHHTEGWHSESPATKPLTCRSVGWLVYDGEHAKIIAPHMTDEEVAQRCGEMTIPSRSVIRIRSLR
mgnify:FL=1